MGRGVYRVTRSRSGRLYALTRVLSRHRRAIAAVLTAAAVAAVLSVLRPPEPERVPVLVAATDLAGGTHLVPGDLTTSELRPAVVPRGALRPGAKVAGRVLAGPMREGEPLTDAGLVGAPLLDGAALVAAPVRIADGGVARLLQAGDRIDVLAAPTRGAALGEPARVVAPGVRVLAVPKPRDGGAGTSLGSPGSGSLVILAATPQQAAQLAGAGVSSRLTVTLRSRVAR